MRGSSKREKITRDRARRRDRAEDHGPLLDRVAAHEASRHQKPKCIVLKPLNAAQVAYDHAITASTVVLGTGPAGTGKTWYAAMRAAEALKAAEIEQIFITRPMVTAEEDPGFLPGDLSEKYDPFLRPVADALRESLGAGALEYHLKAGSIEARPLAYLRGATFKNCWVIVDEAQNMTRNQMKLLLTRIGENCKIIVNGDPAQLDIDRDASGLMDAVRRLKRLSFAAHVEFGVKDIVRSGPCQAIVEAYAEESDFYQAEGFALDEARLVLPHPETLGTISGH